MLATQDACHAKHKLTEPRQQVWYGLANMAYEHAPIGHAPGWLVAGIGGGLVSASCVLERASLQSHTRNHAHTNERETTANKPNSQQIMHKFR